MPAKSDKHLLEGAWVEAWKLVFLQRNQEFLLDYRPNLKQKERLEFQVKCPCCQTVVGILEQKGLQALNRCFLKATEVFAQLPDTNLAWFQYKNGDLFDWIKVPFVLRIWACDACLKTKRAEIANFETVFILNLQAKGGHRPYFYFDIVQGCITCGQTFNFSKNQQRWANEIYVVRAYAPPLECPECRQESSGMA